jgi:acetyl esterase
MHRLTPLLLISLLPACSTLPQGSTPYAPSPAILSVLQERQNMHATGLSGLSVTRAREMPNMIEAARAIPNVVGMPAPFTDVPQTTQLVASGADGALEARMFRPELAKDTPVILYFPGGTWATGTLDQYEESAQQLAARTGWVVVSMRTRLAPEAKFPALHDDAFALYQWARGHLREWGADPTRVALAGEGPGANLELSTALLARDRAAAGLPTPAPDHLLLITPVAGTGLSSVSMSESGGSRPLSRATVDWAQDLYAPGNLNDPRIDIVRRADLAGLPPTTIILAEIDPLRSGGQDLADRMTAAGVPAEARVFQGTTHDFFGLGSVAPEAAAAEDYAATRLKVAFARTEAPVIPGPYRRAPVRRSPAAP